MYDDIHKEQYKNYLKEKYTLAQKIIDEAIERKRFETFKTIIFNVTKLPEEKRIIYSGKVGDYIEEILYNNAQKREKLKKEANIKILMAATLSSILTSFFINLI